MSDITEEAAADEGQTVPFATILAALNRGRTHTELSKGLQDLVEAVTTYEKPGSITLTLKVGPAKIDGALEIVDTITVKAPQGARAASLFFATDDHNLVRNDPRQMALPGLIDVNAGPTELKEAK